MIEARVKVPRYSSAVELYCFLVKLASAFLLKIGSRDLWCPNFNSLRLPLRPLHLGGESCRLHQPQRRRAAQRLRREETQKQRTAEFFHEFAKSWDTD